MRAQRLAFGLTALNLVLLALLLAREAARPALAAAHSTHSSSPATQEVAAILRGRAFELVDERGRIRSRIDVQTDGDVVFRLLDRNGTIRVKLAAGDGGSGLVLLDERTEPGVQLIAKRAATAATSTTTSMTLRGSGGRERIIKP